MPTHLLLEGEDIESVLTQLRDSHGPDAKIVQAELVRFGGVAGFFAKRRYEVTVEVDEDELLGSPVELAEPAQSAQSAEPAIQSFASFAAFRAGTPVADPVRVQPTETGIDALLSAAEDGDSADIRGTGDIGDIGGTPAVTDLRELAIQGWHRPVSTEGAVFSDVLSSLTQNLSEPSPPLPLPTPVPTAGPTAGPTPPATPVEPFAAFGFPLPQPRPEPPVEPPVEPAGADLGPTRERLAALGVPARLLTEVRSAEPLLALRDVVASLPTPTLPSWRRSLTRGGALVVVVGSWPVARHAVAGLVEALGIDAGAVLAVATATGEEIPADQTVRSHAAAVDLVRRIRQQHDVALLVVDPGQTIHSAARVAQLVAALEAQSVVVAADAGARLGLSLTALDALEQADAPADTLALHGLDEAERPAAAFEVPLPIGWVDGRMPTRGSWIGRLMDRLAADGSDYSDDEAGPC